MSARRTNRSGVSILAGLAVVLVLAGPELGRADEPRPSQPTAGADYTLLAGFLSESVAERREAARRLVEAGDRSLIPGLVDALFFIGKTRRAEAFDALEQLSGSKPERLYLDWIEAVGAHEEWRPKDGYLAWKAALFSRIDPKYSKVFYPGAPARIRIEEIVSGGVPFEGIPALDQPAAIPAEKASYLRDGEDVFGAVVGGEARAYPLRLLSWHEMTNDVLGGRPVTLSYCTLCGSAVLYSTATPSGKPYTFGTSGLLYRSNKLMVDRQTLTLWNNLTGEPVVGRLARSSIRLEILPIVRTTWKEWRTRHPETTALALDAALVGRYGYNYQPGAAERQRRGVAFPVWKKSAALAPKAEIFALRLGAVPKVYPLDLLLTERVINDRHGDVDILVLADPEGGAVRAYARGDRVFRPGGSPFRLLDQDDRPWIATEERLEAEGLAPLERLPGHLAYWFGWYGFFPDSEIYRKP